MIKLTIEDDNKLYKYDVDSEYIKYNRELILYSNKVPFLVRKSDGIWYERISNCNYCGACCIISKDEKYLPTKEMEGKIVCKYLTKERLAIVKTNPPVDPSAPQERTLGSPLKSIENAEVYLCRNPMAPMGCCYGPRIIGDCSSCTIDSCTVIFRKLEEE